ncbi:MAG: hypothetical protein ACYDBS_08000 [Acidimicrobiales bacterium]
MAFPARRRTPPPPPPTTLFDTGGLLTLAVDAGLWNLAVSRFGGTGKTVVAVVNELEHLRKDTTVGGLAVAALADLAWLGDPIVLDDDAGRQEAERLRNIIAGGRPVTHPLQHYAEAALIVVGQPLGAQAIIEDYDARVAAHGNGVRPMSVHKLLHLWIAQGVVTSAQAFEYSEAIRSAKRGLDYTEEELIGGGRGLGRVGRP